jgi:hypothetical protein
MGVYAYEERHAIRDALPALGKLAALLFIVGCLYVVDYFVRALFGTATGLVGHIPFAGKVVSMPIHKIEQKISHALGSAEQTIDKHIATSFHKLAKIIRALPRELAMQAAMVFAVVAALDNFLSFKQFQHLLRASLVWLKTHVHMHNALLHRHGHAIHRAQHDATHAEKGAQAVAAQAGSLARTRARSRTAAREHAQDISLARLWKWVRARKTSLTTGVFLGAFAWALGRFGVGWVRCSNWKRIGRSVCGMSPSWISGLLALFLTAEAIEDLPRLVKIMQAVAKETAEGIKDLAEV